MSGPVLKLDWCSHAAAKYACTKWHYSGTTPAAKRVCIGVWENRIFTGVVVFSTGSGSATNGKTFGLAPQFEMAELQRVALNHAHRTPVSKVLAIALRMIRRKCPGLRLIVSFADPSKGHHGGIYQGGNWIYVGMSAPGDYCELTDGRWVHRRSVGRQWGRFTLARRAMTGRKERRPGKYKYLMPLDAEIRERVLPLAKPYPKRATSVDSDAPAAHAGEGGASPTVALSGLRCEA